MYPDQKGRQQLKTGLLAQSGHRVLYLVHLLAFMVGYKYHGSMCWPFIIIAKIVLLSFTTTCAATQMQERFRHETFDSHVLKIFEIPKISVCNRSCYIPDLD